MPDPLYLALWFPSFAESEMMTRVAAVLRQFPFSTQRPGVTYVSIHPVAWTEPTVLERRFEPGTTPEAAIEIARDLLHSDYAYTFEAFWDLWSPAPGGEWTPAPSPVRFIAYGLEFEEATYERDGHLQVELGLDSPFLAEDARLTLATEQRVRLNIQKLVEFTSNVEKNVGISGRVLWSESEENLAQKLIARLQTVH
jgi:hypothetical protein